MGAIVDLLGACRASDSPIWWRSEEGWILEEEQLQIRISRSVIQSRIEVGQMIVGYVQVVSWYPSMNASNSELINLEKWWPKSEKSLNLSLP